VYLKTAAIISAVPFILVMIGLYYSHFKEFRAEALPIPEPRVTPEPAGAASRPTGTPAPLQIRAEPGTGER